MRTRNEKLNRMMPGVAIAAAALVAAAGAFDLSSALVGTGPRVGDIISFETSHLPPAASGEADENVRLLVNRVDQPSCMLDLDIVTHRGGSMVLEARVPGSSHAFFLHWAGEKTSSDAADCGAAADLIVDRRDIDILALTAGGYGVSDKVTPAIGSAESF